VPALRVDDLVLHYDTHGRGEPIFLLHGFTSSHGGNWGRRGWVDVLADHGFRVIGLDFPSHGESERVYDAGRVTTDRLASNVIALLCVVCVSPREATDAESERRVGVPLDQAPRPASWRSATGQ
jgi:pimeloyl-ACP methyl ester carboxylesterase